MIQCFLDVKLSNGYRRILAAMSDCTIYIWLHFPRIGSDRIAEDDFRWVARITSRLSIQTVGEGLGYQVFRRLTRKLWTFVTNFLAISAICKCVYKIEPQYDSNFYIPLSKYDDCKTDMDRVTIFNIVTLVTLPISQTLFSWTPALNINKEFTDYRVGKGIILLSFVIFIFVYTQSLGLVFFLFVIYFHFRLLLYLVRIIFFVMQDPYDCGENILFQIGHTNIFRPILPSNINSFHFRTL